MSSPQMMTMLGLCCCCATAGAAVIAATDLVVSKNRALVIFMMEASLLQGRAWRRIRKIPAIPVGPMLYVGELQAIHQRALLIYCTGRPETAKSAAKSQ